MKKPFITIADLHFVKTLFLEHNPEKHLENCHHS